MDKTVNKATEGNDGFPKPKHVRKLICMCTNDQLVILLYRTLIEKIKKGNEVTQLKGLVVIHSVMLDGPARACMSPIFPEETIKELERWKQTQTSNLSTPVFLNYLKLFAIKIKLHTLKTFIPGSMSEDEFKRNVSKVKLTTIDTLFSITTLLDEFSKVCQLNAKHLLGILPKRRIVVLFSIIVNIVRELTGVYMINYHLIFITFVKLHHLEGYERIITNFNNLHALCKEIFDQISTLRDVTSLISVPQLTDTPPDFSVIVMNDPIQRQQLHELPPEPPRPDPSPVEPPKEQNTPSSLLADIINSTPTTNPSQPVQSFDFSSFSQDFTPFEFSAEPPPAPVEKQPEPIVKIEKVVDTERINALLKRIKELEEEISLMKIKMDELKATHRKELARRQAEQKQGDQEALKPLQERIQELERELEEMQAKNEEIERLRKELEASNEERQRIALLHEQVTQEKLELLDRERALEEEAKKNSESIEQLRKELKETQDEKERVVMLHEKEIQERLELAEKLHRQQDASTKTDAELERLRKEVEEKDKLLQKLKEKEAFITELTKRCQDVEHLLEARQSQTEQLESQLAEKQRELDALHVSEKEAARKSEESAELCRLHEAETLKHAQEMETMRRELEAQRAKNAELETTVTQLKTAMSDVTDDLFYNGIEDEAERELLRAAGSIHSLAKGLEKWLAEQKAATSPDMDIDQAIMKAAQAIAKATAALVTAAAQAQKERVAHGKEFATPQNPYMPNPVWSEGLVSAGRAVADATRNTVTVANANVIPGGEKNEDLLTASINEITKTTAQLVTAARGKADYDSPSLKKVEQSSSQVRQATNMLVEVVKAIAAMKRDEAADTTDFSKLNDYQLIKKEREASVRALRLRRELEQAEARLKELNRQKYERQNQQSQ